MAVNRAMAEAMRLTRAGKLAEASAAFLKGLGGLSEKAEMSSTGAAPHAVAAQRSPANGTFEAREYVGAAGRMDYMLFRPSGLAPGMPLVVMLHGCNQSPEDFACGTGMNELAEGMGFLVAYPRQTQAAHQHKCWNWFRPGDQLRGQGEPALIAGLTHDIAASEQVDPARIYVAGLSAGGAQAAIMADAYPDVFAAVGIHSGLACGAATSMVGALTAMQAGALPTVLAGATRRNFVPVITFHGDRDRTVNEANARAIVEAATLTYGGALWVERERGTAAGRNFTRAISRNEAGQSVIEQWTIADAGHAWSGGNPQGSFADIEGPAASLEMLRFFLKHRKAAG